MTESRSLCRAATGFNESEAQTVVEQWLLEGVKIDAIFAGDDDAATGTMTALRRNGKRIPQDAAVAGFDDLPLAPRAAATNHCSCPD